MTSQFGSRIWVVLRLLGHPCEHLLEAFGEGVLLVLIELVLEALDVLDDGSNKGKLVCVLAAPPQQVFFRRGFSLRLRRCRASGDEQLHSPASTVDGSFAMPSGADGTPRVPSGGTHDPQHVALSLQPANGDL